MMSMLLKLERVATEGIIWRLLEVCSVEDGGWLKLITWEALILFNEATKMGE